LYPNRWDVGAAGHVSAGEDYLDTAIRETGEEIGLAIQKENLDLLLIDKFEQLWENIMKKFLPLLIWRGLTAESEK
jgi:8-oxo-dGTP pyrophosphatase MutT (NUDIX family)